ncbi:hypothetical protein P8452_65534 [Trifolium repens]|nr:hypothetical protein P8452_65534 [Trifolium repens]
MSGPSGGISKDKGINYLALNDLFQMSNESCNDDGLSLPDARLRSIMSTTDVLTLMKLGDVNCAVNSTAINNRSSHSHRRVFYHVSVFTLHINGKDTSGNSIRSCLHLVDLAGSERVDKSEVTGDRV